MPEWPAMLWTQTWWRYDPAGGSDYNAPYHYFNLFEAGVWFVFAALVLVRWGRRRHAIEIAYAALFALFGVTDMLESQALTSWLIWLKLANLIALIWVRAIVIRRHYPGNKLY